jgi:hypothetical protein
MNLPSALAAQHLSNHMQVEMMLLDVFLEGLFEVDLRRVNSEEVGHAMNTVLLEANERIKFPLRKMFVNMVSPRVRGHASAHSVFVLFNMLFRGPSILASSYSTWSAHG